MSENRESELRGWVKEAQHSVDRTQLWLRTTRKSIEWHKEQLKKLREEEKRCAGYVAEAQAHLAECEGWLSHFVARQAEN